MYCTVWMICGDWLYNLVSTCMTKHYTYFTNNGSFGMLTLHMKIKYLNSLLDHLILTVFYLNCTRGLLSWTDKNITSAGYMSWVSNYIQMKLWDVVTYTCPNFSRGLSKLLFKLEQGWVITPTSISGCDYLSMLLSQLSFCYKRGPDFLFGQKNAFLSIWWQYAFHLDGLMQERCNSIAYALELHLCCINPPICAFSLCFPLLFPDMFSIISLCVPQPLAINGSGDWSWWELDTSLQLGTSPGSWLEASPLKCHFF